MRKFEGTVSVNLVGCVVKFEFEAEDDATEEQIEEIAREAAFAEVQWNYEECKK